MSTLDSGGDGQSRRDRYDHVDFSLLFRIMQTSIFVHIHYNTKINDLYPLFQDLLDHGQQRENVPSTGDLDLQS